MRHPFTVFLASSLAIHLVVFFWHFESAPLGPVFDVVPVPPVEIGLIFADSEICEKAKRFMDNHVKQVLA